MLMHAEDSYYESYCWVFGQWQRGKKKKLEKAADMHHANNQDMLSASLLHFSEPLQTSSTNNDSSS
jgi:hypothetical protein